jgi:predicted transcriptional regulator
VEVRLQPDKEVQLAEIAAQRGLSPGELVQHILNCYLEGDARFVEAVNIGIAAADRAEFVEQEEVGSDLGIPPNGGLGTELVALFAKHRSEMGEDDSDFEILEFKGYEVKDPFSE